MRLAGGIVRSAVAVARVAWCCVAEIPHSGAAVVPTPPPPSLSPDRILAGSPSEGVTPALRGDLGSPFAQPIERAVSFLSREVSAWSKENGCFSCHNNGDGARALLGAARRGMPIDRGVLKDSIGWLEHPERWDHNRGDVMASDRRLADLQFASATVSAQADGWISTSAATHEAARRVVSHQDASGAWVVEPENPIGSPTTYGTALATVIAVRAMHAATNAEFSAAIERARIWMDALEARNTPASAAALLWPRDAAVRLASKRTESALQFLEESQSVQGGWGPYRGAPAEAFDTAVALLALCDVPSRPGIRGRLDQGARYLASIQEPDGGWPATTRPSGGDSYAQRMSTTAWATLALLEVADLALR